MTRLSVIIPAHNAADTLQACLDALAEEGVPGPGAELLVVDDGSTDGTRDVAARPDVRVLTGQGRGPAAARNRGAELASGDVLIFLDADTAPQPGWLAELLKPLSDPSFVAVKGAYASNQRALLPRFVQLEFEHKYARLARAERVDFVDTGTAAFRRDVFLASGGFDESFPANSAEDVELAFRLSEQGASFAFNPRARVWHRHPERLSGYLVKKFRYGLFRTEVYRRHPGKALGDSYTSPLMGVQIGLAGLSALVAIPALTRRRAARTCVTAVLAAFIATTLPLVRRALETDPPLAPAVPGLVFARAMAQGLGIAVGLGIRLAGRRSRVPS